MVYTEIKTIQKQLSSHYRNPEVALHIAWQMLQALTDKSRIELITHPYTHLTPEQKNLLEQWLHAHIIQQKPLQYIIGSVPFADISLNVTPPILIPRPETEEWVTELLSRLAQFDHASLRILDIGTGTGCIALALAHALPNAHVIATDISPDALDLAKKNAIKNRIKNIEFIVSDIFKQISPTYQFDLIVSNPPYISEKEWEAVEPIVKTWEDPRALVAPNHGLHSIETIIQQAISFIDPTTILLGTSIPQLIIEIGYQQAAAVRKLFQMHQYHTITTWTDFAGHDRVISGHIPTTVS